MLNPALYTYQAQEPAAVERDREPKADAWWQKVVEVQMVGRGLRRMQGLERLTNLTRASFARNEISHIQGLDACTALQELCLKASTRRYTDAGQPMVSWHGLYACILAMSVM